MIYLKKLNMGRYGWRMHLSCWGLSAIICSIPFALDAQPYGPSGVCLLVCAHVCARACCHPDGMCEKCPSVVSSAAAVFH